MLFHDPSGTIPSVTALATSAVAAGRTVPSPPATTTSRPAAAAALASLPGSSPSASTRRSTSSPLRRNVSTMAAGSGRSTSEPGATGLPPAVGLTNSRIGWRAEATSYGELAGIGLWVRPSQA